MLKPENLLGLSDIKYQTSEIIYQMFTAGLCGGAPFSSRRRVGDEVVAVTP